MLFDVEEFPMTNSMVALLFAMLLLGPVVLATLVDLNGSVPE
jgi:hypothetical protein